MKEKNVLEETLNQSRPEAFQINCFIFALVNILILEQNSQNFFSANQ